MTEVEAALVELEMAVDGWRQERAEEEWKETMRQCAKCKAWVNRHMGADIMRVCPNFNLCESPEE